MAFIDEELRNKAFAGKIKGQNLKITIAIWTKFKTTIQLGNKDDYKVNS